MLEKSFMLFAGIFVIFNRQKILHTRKRHIFGNMLATRSVSGKVIRLPEERWVHVVERHPEMAGHLEDVLIAVATPEFVLKGSNDELLAAMQLAEKKWLVVIYKEETADGFILTAYITSKTEKLFKRQLLWQK